MSVAVYPRLATLGVRPFVLGSCVLVKRTSFRPMEQSTPGVVGLTSSNASAQSNALPTSLMVAVPSRLSTAHQVPGADGAAALTLPAVSLRKATTKQFVQ